MADQSFTPAQVNKYIISNKDYNSFAVKVRLKGTGDPSKITLSPGGQLQCEIRYTDSKAKFYYNGHEVQQLDLNDPNTSDDLNTPNSDYNSHNTLRYVAQNPIIGGQGDLDVINFDSKVFVTVFQDNDGLDGGPTPAFFLQSADSSAGAIKCAVSKNRP